jgi:hypothetical protein
MAPAKSNTGDSEKRMSPYRSAPNDHYGKNMERINEERMFIIKITDAGEYGNGGRSFSIRSSTGDAVYTVKISHKMSCTCTSFVSHCST